jgi:beta-barrel assembly-enhancing protease
MRASAARRSIAAAGLLLIATAQAATRPVPFSDAGSLSKLDSDEQRVWDQSVEISRALERGGVIYTDAEVTAYIQSVMDRLFPEFTGRTRVQVVKSPHLNAFALPDGRVYINQGLLARFQNEAQLATVLAHEGTHFTHRHGYQSQQSVKDNSAFAMFGAMLGIPILPQLMAVSSVFGFSRELESEADRKGFERLVRVGYDVHESPKVFEQLAAEIKAEDIKEPYFFASHPKLAERAESMRKLAAGAAPGGLGANRADYARVMTTLRLTNLENMLSMGRAKSALLMLTDSEQMSELPPKAQYYVAEAYRLRAQAGDAQLAESAYLKAIEAAPEFAPSYRGVGTLYIKTQQYSAASRFLTRYLELDPNAPDRKYVESYLAIAKQKGTQ